jgi:hypothetical protein
MSPFGRAAVKGRPANSNRSPVVPRIGGQVADCLLALGYAE